MLWTVIKACISEPAASGEGDKRETNLRCSNLFRCNNFALITCLSQSESSPSNTSRTPRDPPGTCMWCVGSTVGRGRLAGGANGIWSDPCERSLFVRSSSFALSASFSRLNISSCICRMIRSLLPLSHNLEQDLHQHQVHTFQSFLEFLFY